MLVNAFKCLHLVKNARSYSKKPKDMKFLNVAEKNDAAKTIAGLLSNGAAQRVSHESILLIICGLIKYNAARRLFGVQ